MLGTLKPVEFVSFSSIIEGQIVAVLSPETTDKTLVCKEQVHSDNDMSEVDILRHFGTCGAYWENAEDCMMSFEHFPSHFRLFHP